MDGLDKLFGERRQIITLFSVEALKCYSGMKSGVDPHELDTVKKTTCLPEENVCQTVTFGENKFSIEKEKNAADTL